MADDAPNPRVFEGANNPPVPTPYEAIKVHCEDLYMEAKHWLDGGAITSDAEAEAVEKLKTEALKAFNTADDARVTENKPFDDGKTAVQAKYAPLIGNTKAGKAGKGTMVRLQETCKAALEPWRKKKLAEAEAAAELARQEAAKIAAAAAAAVQAAGSNLESREAAEELVAQAGFLAREAGRAERATTTGTGLTTYYEAVITDRREAVLHYMKERPDEFVALVQRLADLDVREGKRTIPGFTVNQGKRAR